jgi:hypothetical protein
VSSIADDRPFAAAKPLPEATAAATKEAVLKKSLREEKNLLSSFDGFKGKLPGPQIVGATGTQVNFANEFGMIASG